MNDVRINASDECQKTVRVDDTAVRCLGSGLLDCCKELSERQLWGSLVQTIVQSSLTPKCCITEVVTVVLIGKNPLAYSPGKHINLQLKRFLCPWFSLTHYENSWLNCELPNCCTSYFLTDWNMRPYKNKGRRKRKQEQLCDIQLWFCGRGRGVVSEMHFWGCQGYRYFCGCVAWAFSAENWHQLFPSKIKKKIYI